MTQDTQHLRRWGSFLSQGCRVALSGSSGTPQTLLSGSGQGTWRLSDLGVLLGYGHPTQVLNSGVTNGTWGDLVRQWCLGCEEGGGKTDRVEGPGAEV